MMNFTCRYRNHKGEIVSEIISAVSAKAAERSLLLKHPLAELTEEPKVAIEKSGKQGGSGVKRNNRAIILVCVLASCCLALLGIVIGLVLRPSKNGSAEAVSTQKTDENEQELSESQYSRAYRNIVSIHSDDMVGTGFKLRIKDRTYLYTCFHCIRQAKSIIAKDATDKVLELGELEFCYDRDLVRFELPDEQTGFELAGIGKLKVNATVMAYGDTSGRGVMTQNKGKILAVGNHKIEIDAAVLSGNSGGPVLNDEGKVLGVISSGSLDDTVWAKDTRYEKVRKYAERADGGEWEAVSYDDFREVYSLVADTYVMTCELREFSKRISGINFSDRIYRPYANDQLYKGNFGYAGSVKDLYSTWNEMSNAEDERQKLWDDANGKVGTRLEENTYYEVVKRRNNLHRQSTVTMPLRILQFAADELRALDVPYFQSSRKALLQDIETVLIPAFTEDGKFSDRLEKRAYDAYQHDYKKAH